MLVYIFVKIWVLFFGVLRCDKQDGGVNEA